MRKWIENGTVVSTDLNYSFIVTENRSLIMRFELVSALSVKQKEKNEIKIYPNPFKDYLIIKWDIFELAIISELSGKELLRSGARTLDAGIYLINLHGSNNKHITFKIIKE